MCGIVGYIGNQDAAPILLEELSKLEYRGYDSAGIAVKSDDSLPVIIKETGKILNLVNCTNNGKNLTGNIGIGHTRWATNGKATIINAHPHTSSNKEPMNFKKCDANIIGVHNGIIENFDEVKEKLIKEGYCFYSETDSEVLIKLIDYYFNKFNLDPLSAISKAMLLIKGSYALEIMFKDFPNEIWVARKDSPMVVGIKNNESFIASDIPAILKFTKRIYTIDNLEIGKVSKGSIQFFNLNGEEVKKKTSNITLDASLIEESGYKHFMMKEISEESISSQRIIDKYVKNDQILFDIDNSIIKNVSSIIFVGSGSSFNACKISQYLFEDLIKIPIFVYNSSDFRDHKPIYKDSDLFVFVSNNGESKETLEAFNLIKMNKTHNIVITNKIESSLAKGSNYIIDTFAGEEIAFTSTKGFTNSLLALYLLAIYIAEIKGSVDSRYYLNEIKTIPSKIQKILDNQDKIQRFSTRLITFNKALFIGRNIDYASSLEGSFKLKEVCYINSESVSTGDFNYSQGKLIGRNTLVFGILTQSSLNCETMKCLSEAKTQGAYIALIYKENQIVDPIIDFDYQIPQIDDYFVGSLVSVVLQLLSYYGSVAKGYNVDLGN